MRKWFGNLRVAGKLTLGFGVCLALSALNTWSALRGFDAARAAQRVTTEEALPSLSRISQLDIATRQTRTYMIRLAGTEPGALRDELTGTVVRERAATNGLISDYAAHVRAAEERSLYQRVADDWKAYDDTWARLEGELVNRSVRERLQRLEAELSPIFVTNVRTDLTGLREWNTTYAMRAQRDAESVLSGAIQTIRVSFLISLAFGVAFATLVATSITHPLGLIGKGMKSLRNHCLTELQVGLAGFQNGDLTYAIESRTDPVSFTRRDELGDMAVTFNESVEAVQAAIVSYNQSRHGLSAIVSQLANSAESVAATSETLAASGEQSGAASNDIAQGSQKLAVSASESAAVMDELSAQADLVGQASRTQRQHVVDAHRALDDAASGISGVAAAAQNMAAVAVEGNDAVHRTIDAMSRVRDQANASSARVQELDNHGRQIGEIVRTIAGIADQTNLLALNAAIEAARAGEHGRGFAVVAEEVRKLAEQASTSTREISALIKGVRDTVEQTVVAIQATTREVAQGVSETEASGRSLGQILHSAEQVARQAESVAGLTEKASQAMRNVASSVEENTVAAEEMTKGTERVAHSITNVASISEEAAAGAEQLSASIDQVGAAASELAAMSQELQGLVGQFRVEAQTKRTGMSRFARAA